MERAREMLPLYEWCAKSRQWILLLVLERRPPRTPCVRSPRSGGNYGECDECVMYRLRKATVHLERELRRHERLAEKNPKEYAEWIK